MYGAFSKLPHLWDLDEQEQKCVGDASKSSIRGDDTSHKTEALFIGKAGSHCVRLYLKLYCKSYWVYTVKDFIGYLFHYTTVALYV